jgi:hypothetical protein
MGARSTHWRSWPAAFAVCCAAAPVAAAQPATHAQDIAAARALARKFVDAVNAGRPDRLCPLLRGQARVYPTCDGKGRDIGPLLNLAIDGPADIRLVRVRPRRAVAHIPSPATYRCREKTWDRPQRVVMRRRRADGWSVTELRLAEARCG